MKIISAFGRFSFPSERAEPQRFIVLRAPRMSNCNSSTGKYSDYSKYEHMREFQFHADLAKKKQTERQKQPKSLFLSTRFGLLTCKRLLTSGHEVRGREEGSSGLKLCRKPRRALSTCCPLNGVCFVCSPFALSLD